MCMTPVRNFRIYAPFQFVPLPSPTPPSYQSQIFLNALRQGVMPPGPELEPNSWMTWRHEDEVKGTFGITSHGTLSTQVSPPSCALNCRRYVLTPSLRTSSRYPNPALSPTPCRSRSFSRSLHPPSYTPTPRNMPKSLSSSPSNSIYWQSSSIQRKE